MALMPMFWGREAMVGEQLVCFSRVKNQVRSAVEQRNGRRKKEWRVFGVSWRGR
jgi:hypothetical protein